VIADSEFCQCTKNGPELNDHSPGSDALMATALKRYNGGWAFVFVMGTFAREMPGDVSRIALYCSI